MDDYSITVKVHVLAENAREAERLVEELLGDETALTPTRWVESIKTTGVSQYG